MFSRPREPFGYLTGRSVRRRRFARASRTRFLLGRGVWVLRLFVRRGGPLARRQEADRELRGGRVPPLAKPFRVDLDRPLEVAGRGCDDEGACDLRSSSRSHRAVRRGLRWSRKGSGARNTGDDASGRAGGLGVTKTQTLVGLRLDVQPNSRLRLSKETFKASQLPDAHWFIAPRHVLRKGSLLQL